ncbi:UNVERIFIED_CONTAM: hypothetical protein FKN15_008797 [Acipenser sinensis]
MLPTPQSLGASAPWCIDAPCIGALIARGSLSASLLYSGTGENETLASARTHMVTRTVPIPTALRDDLRHHLQVSAAAGPTRNDGREPEVGFQHSSNFGGSSNATPGSPHNGLRLSLSSPSRVPEDLRLRVPSKCRRGVGVCYRSPGEHMEPQRQYQTDCTVLGLTTKTVILRTDLKPY